MNVSVMVFTKGDDQVELKQLQDWKFSQTIKVSRDEPLVLKNYAYESQTCRESGKEKLQVAVKTKRRRGTRIHSFLSSYLRRLPLLAF